MSLRIAVSFLMIPAYYVIGASRNAFLALYPTQFVGRAEHAGFTKKMTVSWVLGKVIVIVSGTAYQCVVFR
jgi:hypothetical protein